MQNANGIKPRSFDKKALILLIGAALILLAALYMRHRLETRGLAARIAGEITEHGLKTEADALKQHSYLASGSVREIMKDADMTAAVEASKTAGFSADIDKKGEVYCLIAAVDEARVLTVFVVNERVELAFIQRTDGGKVEPINEKKAE